MKIERYIVWSKERFDLPPEFRRLWEEYFAYERAQATK